MFAVDLYKDQQAKKCEAWLEKVEHFGGCFADYKVPEFASAIAEVLRHSGVNIVFPGVYQGRPIGNWEYRSMGTLAHRNMRFSFQMIRRSTGVVDYAFYYVHDLQQFGLEFGKGSIAWNRIYGTGVHITPIQADPKVKTPWWEKLLYHLR